MAPRPGLDDDFVFTISDNDDISIQEDEDDQFLEAEQHQVNGLKRKRGSEPATENDSTGKTKNKKQKKGKSGPPKTNGLTPNRHNDDEDEDWTMRGGNDAPMNPDFDFQIGNVDTGVVEDFDGWGAEQSTKEPVKKGNKKGVDIDDLIARRKERQQKQSKKKKKLVMDNEDEDEEEVFEEFASGDEEPFDQDAMDEDDELMAPDGFGMGATGDDESVDGNNVQEGESDEDVETSESDDEPVAAPVAHPDDVPSEDDAEIDPEEKAREDAFFAPESKPDKSAKPGRSSFQTMSLSRPILRGLASVGFAEPTPIQAKTIPIALLGKDIVGGAVTGSGKTGAFMIPILERLLYRPRKIATSRVAILMPTRELAVQCFNVAKKLASFTDITFCQLVGGFSVREQEIVLRGRPDVIIATPGRFIDHMRNSASFTVDTLEILVLDEADRCLEDGFADELNEILTTIPKSRQTMLFSATMTSSVDALIRVGLNQPVRLMVDARKQTVTTLTQEFLRLRPGREDKRLAYLLHLCSEVYTSRCIIFFRQKKEAHRVRIIFSLFGFKAAELHGSMSQEQRIASIESFRSNTVTHLLATDVASRGLDIKGVEVVLNYSAPQSHEIYLHRVGRTARAGRVGRACTIAAEPDRKVVKAAVKTARAQGAKVVSRNVDAIIADEWQKKIDELEEEVEAILKEEKEEKALNSVEMQVKKGENLMKFENEIKARPKRTWFESEKEKKLAKERGAAELNGELAGKKKKLKLSNKQKKKLDGHKERVEGRMWKKGKGDAESKPGKGSKKGGVAKGKPGTKKKVKRGRR